MEDNKMNIVNGVLYEYDGMEENVFIPNNVEEITGGAFRRTAHTRQPSTIKSIRFGENVKIIDAEAFMGQYKLDNVGIPFNVKKLYLSAFYNCDNLKNFKVFSSIVHGTDIIVDVIVEKDNSWYVKNDNLPRFLGNLNEECLLDLIEICPKVCFAIPSEICTSDFMKKAHEKIVYGMKDRVRHNPKDMKAVEKDVAIVPALKKWEKQEKEKHMTPAKRLQVALDEFEEGRNK